LCKVSIIPIALREEDKVGRDLEQEVFIPAVLLEEDKVGRDLEQEVFIPTNFREENIFMSGK
jgi:hypothetical protein